MFRSTILGGSTKKPKSSLGFLWESRKKSHDMGFGMGLSHSRKIVYLCPHPVPFQGWDYPIPRTPCMGKSHPQLGRGWENPIPSLAEDGKIPFPAWQRMGKSHSHVLVGGEFPSPICSEKAIPIFNGMGIPSHSHRDYPIPTVSLIVNVVLPRPV